MDRRIKFLLTPLTHSWRSTVLIFSPSFPTQAHGLSGHDFIDVLKIDIESAEFPILTAIIKPYLEIGKPLPFGQLQIELHLWHKSFEEILEWWQMLEEAGLRPFWTEVYYFMLKPWYSFWHWSGSLTSYTWTLTVTLPLIWLNILSWTSRGTISLLRILPHNNSRLRTRSRDMSHYWG